MARIRALKPGFFKNHALYIAERDSKLPLRLAYEGLWCVADREGRFKWKPEEIKTDVLPYDDVDMAAVLDALVRYKFIFKYKCDGEEYGFIPTFLEHQHVNKNEAPSTIPIPPKNSNARAKRVNARKAPVVAPSKHHEELVSGVREQEQEGESISAVPASTPTSKNSSKAHKNDFAAFYLAYPKHVARGAAAKAYVKALSRASPEVILAGAQRYAIARAREDPSFTKNPATWLNADCWLDETPGEIPTVNSFAARLAALPETDDAQ